jgi:hypothetical protein
MVLTRENNTFFTGGAFQYAITCYRQIGKLMDAFRTGGGVPFHRFRTGDRRGDRTPVSRGAALAPSSS